MATEERQQKRVGAVKELYRVYRVYGMSKAYILCIKSVGSI